LDYFFPHMFSFLVKMLFGLPWHGLARVRYLKISLNDILYEVVLQPKYAILDILLDISIIMNNFLSLTLSNQLLQWI
jgi:hypothetical protein